MAEAKALAGTALSGSSWRQQPWWQPPPAVLANLRELGVPLAVLGIVIALITPLPGVVLDVLIVTDVMTSVIVLMVSPCTSANRWSSVFSLQPCCF